MGINRKEQKCLFLHAGDQVLNLHKLVKIKKVYLKLRHLSVYSWKCNYRNELYLFNVVSFSWSSNNHLHLKYISLNNTGANDIFQHWFPIKPSKEKEKRNVSSKAMTVWNSSFLLISSYTWKIQLSPIHQAIKESVQEHWLPYLLACASDSIHARHRLWHTVFQ